MAEVVSLIGAIYFIYFARLLNAFAALPIVRPQVRFDSDGPTDVTRQLIEEMVERLTAEGFDPIGWLRTTSAHDEPLFLPFAFVLRHPSGGLVTLMAPVHATAPHHPYVQASHRLRDGRVAITQWFDAWLAITSNELIVGRSGTELDVLDMWRAHEAWAAELGIDPAIPTDAEILDEAGALDERHRQALLRNNVLEAVNDDLARPTLTTALRMLRTYLRLPKPIVADSIPRPELLVRHVQNHDIIGARSPSRAIQLSSFGVSVVLFMAIGALFWDAVIAFTILVVVVIHELGHYLSMRAFGYKNVHLLALPLIGGVTVGRDDRPSATRRAWMSLMGPLPGIVIGWLLIAAAALGGGTPNNSLLIVAIMFLAVNYLNVLPVPPLDGAVVLESLLPPRGAQMQTLFFGAMATVGGLVALYFEIYVIAVLAVLQLFGLRAQWRLRGVERALAQSESFAVANEDKKILTILTELEREFGPASRPAQRIQQASALLTRMKATPMGALARLLTSGVYLSLLAGPVAGIVVYASMAVGMPELPDVTVTDAQRAAYLQTAKSMPLAAIVTSLAENEPLPPPATEAAIAATEARLGARLPDDLRTVYAIADGLPTTGIGPVASIDIAASFVRRDIAPYTKAVHVLVDDQPTTVALTEVERWWVLGASDGNAVFFIPATEPRPGGNAVVDYYVDDLAQVRPSLRVSLETSWVEAQVASQLQAERAKRVAAVRAELADASVEELLASMDDPNPLSRLLAEQPEGASDAALAELAERAGTPLPDDFASALRLHDGFANAQLLPTSKILPWRDAKNRIPAPVARRFFEPVAEAPWFPMTGRRLEAPTEADVATCWVVAGYAVERELYPQLLWCPEGPTVWIDFRFMRAYPSFREWLVDQAAPRRAF